MKNLLFILLITGFCFGQSTIRRVNISDSTMTNITHVESDSSLRVSINPTTQPIYMSPFDTSGNKMWDAVTGAMMTVTYEHHEIHSGSHYYISGWDNLANAADSLDFCIFTRDTTRWMHIIFEVSTEKAMLFEVYEGATFDTTSGSAVTVFNNNRNSGNTTTYLIRRGCTISALGTKIDDQLIGKGDNPSNSIGGDLGRGRELILKQNTYYRFHFNTVSNDNDVSWLVEFYEHTNKN